MTDILTPEFIKLLGGLVALAFFLVRWMERRDHHKAAAEQLRAREEHEFRQQMLRGMQTIQREQERLDAWARDHEHADRIRFRRLERRLQSVLPPEAWAAGWLI